MSHSSGGTGRSHGSSSHLWDSGGNSGQLWDLGGGSGTLSCNSGGGGSGAHSGNSGRYVVHLGNSGGSGTHSGNLAGTKAIAGAEHVGMPLRATCATAVGWSNVDTSKHACVVAPERTSEAMVVTCA